MFHVFYTSTDTAHNAARTLLRNCTIPSPPSTVLLLQDKLSKITNPLIQQSVVIQILRFVSPHPWGSPAAEAFRKSASLDRIVASLFVNCPDKRSEKRVAFSAGSHVLWVPVYIKPDGQVKHTKPTSGTERWTEGWLASRLPPYRSENNPSGRDIDITSLILDKKSSANCVEVVYDNRFILSFNRCAIPDEVTERLQPTGGGHRLVISGTGKYLLPRLALWSADGNHAGSIGIAAPGVGSLMVDPGGGGRFPSEASWANWRVVRAFE